MVTPDYAAAMAAYNAEMNRRLYAAAARLPDATRRRPEGAFWSSLHGTLNHLLWADHQWMSRLADWPRPPGALPDSAGWFAEFDGLAAARVDADTRMVDWAGTLDQAWIDGTLTWFSGATRKQQTRPRAIILMHLFNHQTHHRGQAHALLTRAGEDTGATDLAFVLDR